MEMFSFPSCWLRLTLDEASRRFSPEKLKMLFLRIFCHIHHTSKYVWRCCQQNGFSDKTNMILFSIAFAYFLQLHNHENHNWFWKSSSIICTYSARIYQKALLWQSYYVESEKRNNPMIVKMAYPLTPYTLWALMHADMLAPSDAILAAVTPMNVCWIRNRHQSYTMLIRVSEDMRKISRAVLNLLRLSRIIGSLIGRIPG